MTPGWVHCVSEEGILQNTSTLSVDKENAAASVVMTGTECSRRGISAEHDYLPRKG